MASLLAVAVLLTVTAEFSDFQSVGTLRLPHRVRLQARDTTEHWTIERAEIVPLP